MRFWWIYVLMCFLYALPNNASASEYQRIENQTHAWYLLESDHFNFYFADSSISLAKSILPSSVIKLNQIEEKIGYRLSGKINIFLHPSGAALNATYASQNETIKGNTGGITTIKNNDVHVYSIGELPNLMEQISAGIADNLLLEMMYGGTVQERIKYAALLQLPTWFQEGLVRYLAVGWDTESDNLLRDAFNNQQFKSFNQLTEEQQILVGQNMWLYIDENKSEDAIQRILYLVRLTRKVETALYFVLNKTTKQLFSEWYSANIGLYAAELNRRIPQKPEKNVFNPTHTTYINSALSLDANFIASAYRENGKVIIEIYDRIKDSKQIIRSEYDYFDGMQMVPDEILIKFKSDNLIWILTNKPTPVMELYSIETGKFVLEYTIPNADYIRDFDYFDKKDEFIFSSVKNGKSSLVLASNNFSKFTRLSDSPYDDMEAHFDNNGNIYFTRILLLNDDKIVNKDWQKDIFYMFRHDDKVLSVNNVTNTSDIDEELPIKLNTKYLSYISNQNGIRNAYAYKIDQKTFALSNYQTGIIKQQINPSRTHVLETVLHNGYIFTHISPVDSSENFGAVLYPSKTKILIKANEKINNASKNNPQLNDSLNDEDREKVYFQSSFPLPDNVDSLDAINQDKLKKFDYSFQALDKGFKGIRPYKIVSQLNNDLFLSDDVSTQYDIKDQMVNKIGIVSGVGLSDQFNNHIINGKMRTTFNFKIFQFEVSYENRIGKINKKFTVKSEQTRYLQNLDLGKRRMRTGEVEFTKQWNSKWSTSVLHRTRFDQFTPILQDETYIELENLNQLATDNGFRLRYKTTSKATNDLLVGLFGEISSQYRYNYTTSKSSFITSFHGTYGKRIGENLIWQNRVDFANSTGNANTIFALGGNRNQYRPTVHSNPLIIDDAAFIRPVYGVRNFAINTRSGNTYGFVNSELWLPVNKYLGKRPIKNIFLQKLWLIGFADAGTAWFGPSPNDKKNIANVTHIYDGRLNISIYNAKNPFIYSGGLGLRTSIFGYFVRYDLAWTYDNNVINSGVSMISLGKNL